MNNVVGAPAPVTPAPAGSPYEGLFAVLLPIVALIGAIFTVKHDPELPYLKGNYSPLGYTYSLSLFLVPTISMSVWLIKARARLPHQWRAFWITAAIVVPCWCLLDFLLGNTFFYFPNREATLGIYAPGLVLGQGWPRTIPIEEFAFYIFGCSTILLGYIWASESWLNLYTLPRPAYLAQLARTPKLVNIHVKAVIGGVVVFLAALAWKKLGYQISPGYREGFPGYFLFELVLVIGPTAFLSRAVDPMINRPALIYKTLSLVAASLLWEVTLAMPYGWWAYHHDQMIGIVIRPWFNLPIEAAMLWPCAAWMNITLYEAARIYVNSDRPLFQVLFGTRNHAQAITWTNNRG